MYSTHNKEKYVIAERFIRTLKNKLHKYDFNFNIKETCILTSQTMWFINTIIHIIAQSK